MPFVIIWSAFSTPKALVISLLYIATYLIERLFPCNHKKASHPISETISAIGIIVFVVPLILIIWSRISVSPDLDNVSAIIWDAIVSYFGVFDTISSLNDFSDAITTLIGPP